MIFLDTAGYLHTVKYSSISLVGCHANTMLGISSLINQLITAVYCVRNVV